MLTRISPRFELRIMLPAASEVAIAIRATSVPSKPAFCASARASCRAVTMSASESIRTLTVLSVSVAMAALLRIWRFNTPNVFQALRRKRGLAIKRLRPRIPIASRGLFLIERLHGLNFLSKRLETRLSWRQGRLDERGDQRSDLNQPGRSLETR